MTPRSIAIALVNVPLLVAGVEAASFYRANRSTDAIVSSGERRTFVLHVPAKHDAAKPSPLVISLHAAGLWGAAQESISQWNRVADEEGFIVAYPSAQTLTGPNVWYVSDGGVPRDARFIADLIDTLSARYRIDPARIYVDGLSNGGGMSFILSCTLPDRIAAFGMVGAALVLSRNSCPDPRPAPVMVFHGTADPAVPYDGGASWVAPKPFPNVPRFVAAWAERNGCRSAPTDSLIAPHVVRSEWAGCVDHADVVFYTVRGGGHTWPSGGEIGEWFVGPTTREIDATRELWAFYRAHPLRSVGSSRR